MIGDIPPYDDWAGNHVDDLKKIPHVAAFYNYYGDDVLIWEESGRFYQLGFQATADAMGFKNSPSSSSAKETFHPHKITASEKNTIRRYECILFS